MTGALSSWWCAGRSAGAGSLPLFMHGSVTLQRGDEAIDLRFQHLQRVIGDVYGRWVTSLAAPSMRCGRCGEPIVTRAKPGNTVRCRKCGYAQRFRPHGDVAARGAGGVGVADGGAVWDPPSTPRGTSEDRGPCPSCGGAVVVSPGGTVWVCRGDCGKVAPSGVLAPHQRDTSPARQVRTQRERDLDALALAKSKGIMLAQLKMLAGDTRIDPVHLPAIEWFADEVRGATSQARLMT